MEGTLTWLGHASFRPGGVRITLTEANHSSSASHGRYLDEPADLVVELEDGTTLYFAGDTIAL